MRPAGPQTRQAALTSPPLDDFAKVQDMPIAHVPSSYAEWRHCIEFDCRQPLTADFIATRLAALNNPADAHTRDFTRLYGESHLRAVIAWFTHAASEPRA